MAFATTNWLSVLLMIFGIFKYGKCELSAFDMSQTQMQKKNVNFEEIYPHAIDTCKIKERASDLDVENVINNFLPKTTTEKCFVACWLETFGVIVNRRFDRDQYIKLSTYGQTTDDKTKNVLKKILQRCTLHNTCKQNRCELAYRIMKCISDGAAQLNIDPKTL